MFSLFKRNKEKAAVPKWASFFNKNEYNEFLDALEDYFYAKNVTYNLGDGQINAGPNDFGFSTLGLTNVAQVCKLDKLKNYKEKVTEHFEALIRTNQFDKEFKKIIHDFEQVKEYIAVRLYPDDYVPETAKEVSVRKHFAGDIIALLVFDLPDSVMSITSDVANKWNKTLDDLFETGIQNIKNKYPLKISKQQVGELEIWFVQGNHFFTPNIVFDLNNQQKLIGSYGSLIGIPHRHAVIIYPIEDMQVIKALNALIPTVHGMNAEGPGSVSNNIFWYKDGEFENLPYKIEEGQIQFYPPESFVNLLNTLESLE
ncbi:MAG TPA: hypothetical protein VIM16_09900 [Mucilaginibacter sp.]|jgi:hypothetical protein